jgi:hypothetical protein
MNNDPTRNAQNVTSDKKVSDPPKTEAPTVKEETKLDPSAGKQASEKGEQSAPQSTR